MTNYIREFIRFLATSFCEFESKKDIFEIRKDIHETELDELFKIYVFSEYAGPQRYRLFKEVVRKTIEKNGHEYAMSRFIVANFLGDAFTMDLLMDYLFSKEDWYKKCEKEADEIAKKFFKDEEAIWVEVMDSLSRINKDERKELNDLIFKKTGE